MKFRGLRLRSWISIGLALIGASTLLDAARCFAEDFQSPRTMALGGAGHAGPLLNDSIYLNPSYSSFLPTYAVSGNFEWANFQDGSYKYKIDNASVQDGRSDLFQAGVAYTHRDDGTFIHIGAGRSLISQRLGLGLGGKLFMPAADGSPHMFDSTFSMTGIPFESVQTALIVDNLIESQTEQQYGLFREFIVGTKFNLEKIVLVYIDPHYVPDLTTNSKYGYEAGAEWPIMVDFFLRAGVFHSSNVPALGNGTRGNGFGLGAGMLSPKVSVDYGLSRVLEPIIGTIQSIGFTMYL
jgi:hypothetical protein